MPSPWANRLQPGWLIVFEVSAYFTFSRPSSGDESDFWSNSLATLLYGIPRCGSSSSMYSTYSRRMIVS